VLSIVCLTLPGISMQLLSLLQYDKMKWQVDSNNIVVSRFYRLEERPWRFILQGNDRRKLSGT